MVSVLAVPVFDLVFVPVVMGKVGNWEEGSTRVAGVRVETRVKEDE